MEEPRTDLAPALIAGYDQLSGSLGQLAQVAAGYYRKLREQGVPEGLAAALVKDWHEQHCLCWMDTDG